MDGKWRIQDPARRALTATEYVKGKLYAGDLVITKSSGSADHLGKTALVSDEVAALDCCFSNFMQRVRATRLLHPGFLSWFFNSSICREQINYLGACPSNAKSAVMATSACGSPKWESQDLAT
jgi:type I restriction enzyme S subunit